MIGAHGGSRVGCLSPLVPPGDLTERSKPQVAPVDLVSRGHDGLVSVAADLPPVAPEAARAWPARFGRRTVWGLR